MFLNYIISSQQEEGGHFFRNNANGIKVKYLSNLPKINIGANLQIFL